MPNPHYQEVGVRNQEVGVRSESTGIEQPMSSSPHLAKAIPPSVWSTQRTLMLALLMYLAVRVATRIRGTIRRVLRPVKGGQAPDGNLGVTIWASPAMPKYVCVAQDLAV